LSIGKQSQAGMMTDPGKFFFEKRAVCPGINQETNLTVIFLTDTHQKLKE